MNEKPVQVVVFDLDGTLTLSKQALTDDVAELLKKLLEEKYVGVISGGGHMQMEEQFLAHLPSDAKLNKLFVMPVNGAELYEHKDGELSPVYKHLLSEEEDAHVREALEKALTESGFDRSQHHWGERTESRGSQVTFSALGQEAPIDEKLAWDPDKKKRLHILQFLTPLLPDYEIHLGGVTTIDVTKKGIDKAFALREFSKHLGIPIEEMAYVGDALFPGGNDEVVKQTGIRTYAVTSDKSLEDTKAVMRQLLNM
jgi:HAD superfamily hydrolase (TIGR01484 family)